MHVALVCELSSQTSEIPLQILLLWMSVQALLGLESGRSCTMKQSGFGGVDECAFTLFLARAQKKGLVVIRADAEQRVEKDHRSPQLLTPWNSSRE